MKNNTELLSSDTDYRRFIESLKTRLTTAQLKAARMVNTQLLEFYWQLGKDILIIQSDNKHWGSGFISQLSEDLRKANPGISGFSKRSLEYMRQLATVYPSLNEFTQHPAAQLPWSHVQLLLDKFKSDPSKYGWYAGQTLENGWSRSTLNMHIKSHLYERQSEVSAKTSNYHEQLTSPHSDLAHEMLKNPYNFDFLTISKKAKEREIESALTSHIRDFLIELGAGFAFVGRQVPIDIDGEEFFIDLLFYHLKLRCYIVCELKAKKFKPADAGQLSFYLTAVDEKLRQEHDNPTIGILLCESRSKIIAEYALKQIKAPIGVSEYILERSLPKDLKTDLPSIDEIESGLSDAITESGGNVSTQKKTKGNLRGKT